MTIDLSSPLWGSILIPVVVPLLIAGIKQVTQRIPGYLLPILAPLLGAGLDILTFYATGHSLGPVWGAALGSAGVGLREVVDQLKQRVKNGAT